MSNRQSGKSSSSLLKRIYNQSRQRKHKDGEMQYERLVQWAREVWQERFPDVPTIAEYLPGYRFISWQGFLAPAGVPNDVVARLNAAAA